MKPESVRIAQVRGDREALSLMGRAGAKASARKRVRDCERRALFAKAEAIRRAEEEYERAVSANEHVVPVDSGA